MGTPALLASGRLEPRKVVGSVDTAEFLVAFGASAGFLVSLSFAEINFGWVLALLAGGLVAAPLAAWLVRKLPARVLGSAVGGLILVTNLRTFSEALGIDGPGLAVAYLVLVGLWITALAISVSAVRREARGALAPA